MARTDEIPITDGARDERAGFRATLSRMSEAQKPNRGAPPYSRWINRRLGRVIAAAAFRVGLVPNAVTAISAAFTFSALALVALVPPVFWLGPAVATLLALGYAFDAADGQLARISGRSSRRGEWLDHMVDVTKTCVLHAVVLVSLVRFGDLDGSAVLLVPLAYLTVAVVLFFGQMLVDQLRRSAGGGVPSARREGAGLLQTAAATPTDYGILSWSFIAFGAPPVFLVVYSALFAGHALITAGALVRWWRELGALDRADRAG